MLRPAGAAALAALALLAASAPAEDVSALLEPIRQQHALPALAAAVMQDGKLVAIGATGLRRLGGTQHVTVNDQWHLGSCTKSMTAAVAAMLVEQGKIRWDTTIGATLADLQPAMKDAWKPVTLNLLLCHRAGAPHNAPPALWAEAWKREGTPHEQRDAFVRGLLAEEPESPPGTRFSYSNQGYTIATAMLTRAAHQTWEPMMQEMLFRPLDMKSAGFGAPGTPDQEDQPWGHEGEGPDAKPVPPGPHADNPPSIWPGGGVHVSIGDFAKYAEWQALESTLLKPESFRHLHTPLEGQDYGFGWIKTTRPWGGTVFNHNGTNTTNFAVMWISPEKKFAVVAATNMGGKSAELGTDAACAMLIGRVLEGRK